ncbi:MAG: putative ABC transporter ATP-binding protein YufO [Acidimicrobiaceae bacterium]|nr:MAG: putative ABC transporter ATP-binding protein YufO [Acidimicrobiaceae bacterium]
MADPLADTSGVEPTDVAEGHVLPDREGLDEAEVLVHHGDAVGSGIDRVHDLYLPTVEPDLPGVGEHETDEHLHQRGLAGAVLAEDAVDLPPVQREAHPVAGDDLAEVLGDVDELHSGRGAVPPTRVVFEG